MNNFFAKIKEHPYITAGIALVGGIVLYTAFFSGSSSGGAPSQAQLDAANFATQTQGATQLAVAQAAQQAEQYRIGQEATVAEQQIQGATSIAQLQAQTVQNAQQLQAGVQQSLIAGSLQENLANTAAGQTLGLANINAGVQQSTLAATVAEQQIAANQAVAQSGQNYGFQFGMAALQGAEAAPHPTSFNSPFGNYNTGGTYVAPPAPPPPPPVAPQGAGTILNIDPIGGGGVYLEPGGGGLASIPFPQASGSGAGGSSSWFGDTSQAAMALSSFMQQNPNADAGTAATVAAESGPYDPFIAAHLPQYDTTFATIYNAIQTQQASNTGPVGH